MGAWVYLILIDIAGIASGTYLVVTEHYGWAWIPFLLACTTTIGRAKEK